jgi:hypothetical protein
MTQNSRFKRRMQFFCFLRGMLKADGGAEGPLLQQLCKMFSAEFQELSEGLVRQLLQNPSGLTLPNRHTRKRRRSQMAIRLDSHALGRKICCQLLVVCDYSNERVRG